MLFVNKGLNKLQILTALISRITVNRYKNEHSEAEKWTRGKHFDWDSKEEDTNSDPSPPPFQKYN